MYAKLRWYCGLYASKPRWHNTEHWEPEECGTEFVTTEPQEEVDQELCTAVCPKCNGTLTMIDDAPVQI